MPTTFSYQWESANPDGSGLADIVGASGTFVGSPPTTFSESYTIDASLVGKKIRLRVSDGTTTTYSAWSSTVTAAPSPGATSIYWGAFMDGDQTYGTGYTDAPWGLNTWDKFEADAGGKTVSICHFGQPQWWSRPSFDTTAHNNCWNRGAIPFVDYGGADDLAAIIAGTYDADITAWANAYKNWGKPAFIRLWWEMNQYGSHWFSWAVPYYFTAAQYVAAWQHVWSICNSVGATNMTFVWCPNFIGTDSSRVSLIQDCYPGDAYVDWLAFDGYNSFSPSQNFDDLYQLTYDTLVGINATKPIMVGEFASRDASIFASGVKASWITDALTNKIPGGTYDNIKAIVWFNWKITESGVQKDWPIESSSSAQSAFASAVGSTYYESKFASVPAFGKVPIP